MTYAKRTAIASEADFADARVRVEQRPGYLVLTPLDTLRDHALVPAPHGESGEAEAIACATRALDGLAPEFPGWMTIDIERLADARARYRVHGASSSARDDLYQAAHALRGDAGQFGFPLIGVVADSLAKLIEHCPPTESPDDLISQHVDAIRAMMRESGSGDAQAKELAAAMMKLTGSYLAAVAPEALADPRRKPARKRR